MDSEKFTKLFQMIGAGLALPAAAAGAFAVYKSNFSSETTCQNLRTVIISTMEKNMAADAKRALLAKDVDEFQKACGAADPEALKVFRSQIEGQKSAAIAVPRNAEPAPKQSSVSSLPTAPPGPNAAPASPSAVASATMTPPPMIQAAPVAPQQPAAPNPAQATPAPVQMQPAAALAPAPAAVPPKQPTANAGVSPSGKPVNRDTRTAAIAPPPATQAPKAGWVLIGQRAIPGGRAAINFDGFVIAPQRFPPAGTILTARTQLNVWGTIQDAERGSAVTQSTLKPGNCVKVLSKRVGSGRLWGEVVPSRCM